MLCYHGTNADNLESILKNGLLCEQRKVWNVSEDAVYAWTNNFIEKNYRDEKEEEWFTPEYIRDLLIRQAFDSACSSLGTSKDCRTVVVIFEVPDEEIEIDGSCNNMEDASCIHRDIKKEEIREILISNDLSLLRGWFISLMVDRDLSNLEFTHLEYQIGSMFKESGFYFEIEDILEWENVKIL